MVPQEQAPLHAGELRALIRLDQHLILRLAPPPSHEQGLQHDIHGVTAPPGPTDHTTGVAINDDGKIGEALAGPDVGYVRNPHVVRKLDVELPVKRVIDNDGRSAAGYARTVLVADLCLDPGKTRRARNSVRAARLPQVE